MTRTKTIRGCVVFCMQHFSVLSSHSHDWITGSPSTGHYTPQLQCKMKLRNSLVYQITSINIRALPLPSFILSAVQYSTVQQYITVQLSTLQYSSVQYSIAQYITVQFCSLQYSSVLYSIVRFFTVQFSSLQQSSVHFSIVWFILVQFSLVPTMGCVVGVNQVQSSIVDTYYIRGAHTVQCSEVQCSALQCSALRCSEVHYTALQY